MRHSANAKIDASSRVKPSGARLRVLVLAILALSGCATVESLPLPGPANLDPSLTGSRWWQCLGDTQLSGLNERALVTAAAAATAPTAAQHALSVAVTARYIDLRARQSALVLLAVREQLDSPLVVTARLRRANDNAPRLPMAAAELQLAKTRAAQSRTRAEIAALRERLTVLTGLAPRLLDRLPGGPIPLPSPPLQSGRPCSLAQHSPTGEARYAAARVAAEQAQALAVQARTTGELLDMSARAGKVAPGQALAADRQALDALQAEQRARAAMAQAYVALVEAQAMGGLPLAR